MRVRGPVDLGEIDGARPRAIEEQTCHGAVARVLDGLELERERRVQPLHELLAAVALRAGRLLQHWVRSAAREESFDACRLLACQRASLTLRALLFLFF